jgi:fatty-acyl-CoA synthase
MEHTMMRYELTIDPIFRRAKSLYATREIVSRRPDKSVHRETFADFDRRARKLASALQKAGLKKGDRVATLMWNHNAHLEAYFGIPLSGGLLHTLNLRLSPDELAYIVGHAGDRFLFIDDVLWPLFERIKDRVQIERVFVFSPSGKPAPAGAEDFEAFLAGGDEAGALPQLLEEDAFGLCYTSGTTGKAKGVVYSQRAIALHSLGVGLVDSLGLSHRDTVLPVVPMFHVNAWGLPFGAVMVGAKMVMPGPHLDAENLLDLFEKERVTVGAGVPTIWLGILDALDKNPKRWKLMPDLRMVVGGSAVPESMIRRFDGHGMTIIHAWGMTETTPLGTVARLGPQHDDWSDDQKYAYRARQGVPSPGIELRAEGEKGLVPWDGKSAGELQIRGAWVAGSYYNAPPEGADRWTPDGWFKTGDVVTLDGDGCIKITDRSKDVIKSGGEWISSMDLENTLVAHPAIKEACVVAIPDPKWDERPLAVIVLREGQPAPTLEEVRAFLAKKFEKWELPDAVEVVDAIPKSGAGKYLKRELRERYKAYKKA